MGTNVEKLPLKRLTQALNSGEAVMAFAAHLAAELKDRESRDQLYGLAVQHIKRNKLESPRKGWQHRVKLPSRSRS